jgi:hypothetical protein
MFRSRAGLVISAALLASSALAPWRCLADDQTRRLGSRENPYSVALDHATGIVNPYGPLRLGDGDWVRIHITSTEPDLFSYNLVPQESRGQESLGKPDTSISLNLQHDGTATSYQVSATCGQAGGCKLLNRIWVLPVLEDKWVVSFAGAFTVDGLTDEVYSLTPEAVTGTGGTSSTQYRVHRNEDAEDNVSLSTAAMVHLHHTRRLNVGKSVQWSPISFGLGLSSGAEPRYFLGTSLKFGDAAFVTGGVVFGKQARLPNGLTEGGVTTDPNALNGSATRTAASVFVGLSYGFAATEAKARLLQPFSVAK